MFLRGCAAIVALVFVASDAMAEVHPQPDGAASLAPYARVEIAPTKTSIYIGRISMTMPAFVREQGRYASTYVARVFPYFFLGEEGRLTIDVSDESLHALARGERIEFRGVAHNTQGEARRVEGAATPADAASGKIKVRVFVSKRIQLIFNTTYRFAAP